MHAVSKTSLALTLLTAAALALGACSPTKTRSVSKTAQATTAPSATSATPVGQGRVLPQGQPVKVAVLLPLSGRIPEVGQQLMNASQMALFDMPQNSIELLIKDSGDTPQMAAAALQQAVNEGAQLALGPLFGSQARAASTVARQANINLIAFSNDLSQLDGNAFLMGLSPDAQADRVTSYAMQQGFRQLAVLAPDTEFGRLSLEGARTAAVRNGGEIVSSVFYPPEQLDIGSYIDSLSGTFQALLVPDAHGRMLVLAPALSAAGYTAQNTKFLGSTLWSDPALLSEPNLQGAWLPGVDPQSRQNFVARYQDAYGSVPQPIASVAFDAVTLAGYLARQALNGQANAAAATPGQWVGLDRNTLLSPAGFRGVDGIFRFQQNGAVQRGLAVLAIEPTGFVVVSPSPTSFDTLGF